MPPVEAAVAVCRKDRALLCWKGAVNKAFGACVFIFDLHYPEQTDNVLADGQGAPA